MAPEVANDVIGCTAIGKHHALSQRSQAPTDRKREHHRDCGGGHRPKQQTTLALDRRAAKDKHHRRVHHGDKCRKAEHHDGGARQFPNYSVLCTHDLTPISGRRLVG